MPRAARASDDKSTGSGSGATRTNTGVCARTSPSSVTATGWGVASTADWTVEDLRERIEEIRIAYVKLLAEWPAPGTAL